MKWSVEEYQPNSDNRMWAKIMRGPYLIGVSENLDFASELVGQHNESIDQLLGPLREIDSITKGDLPLTAQIKELAQCAIKKANP